MSDKNLYYCEKCNEVYENSTNTPSCIHKSKWIIIYKKQYIDWILSDKRPIIKETT